MMSDFVPSALPTKTSPVAAEIIPKADGHARHGYYGPGGVDVTSVKVSAPEAWGTSSPDDGLVTVFDTAVINDG